MAGEQLVSAITSSFGLNNITTGILPMILVIVIFVALGFGGLYIMKLKKYVYPVDVMRSLGNGKVGIVKTKAGKFRKHKILFGLIDRSGSFEMLLKDGRKILEYSDNDMHCYNPETKNYDKPINNTQVHSFDGRMGFVCYQKPDDPRIIVPISTISFTNTEAVMAIAPAEYMDASQHIMTRSEEEMKTGMEKALAQVLPFIYIMVTVLVIIFLIQYGKYTIDKIAEMMKNAQIISPALQLPSKAP